MLFVKKAMLLILSAALFGCAGVKNQDIKQETELSVSTKIVKGKTTKNEIEEMLDSPAFSSFDTGLEVWKYEFFEPGSDKNIKDDSVDIYGARVKNRPSFPSTRHLKKELTVIFDDNGIVKEFHILQFPNLP